MLKEMFLLVKQAAHNGAETALAENISLSNTITKSEAYRCYGRTNVDRWFQEGLLKPVVTADKKSQKSIDRQKLEAIASASNRITYLTVADR